MKSEKSATAKDVNAYLARVPADARASLEKLRQTIKSAVPDAVEVISYGIPTFRRDGRMLVSYAAFSEHCSFFPGAGPIDVHQDELKSFQTSKGTVRFTTAKPLSSTMVKKLLKTRIRLNEEQMKKRAAKKTGARKAVGAR
ncbi:MAG: iron chaperone [Pyrinomonadaceae bacterium]